MGQPQGRWKAGNARVAGWVLSTSGAKQALGLLGAGLKQQGWWNSRREGWRLIRWALRPTGFVGVGWGAWLERQGRAGKAGFPWLLLGQALCVGVGKAAHLLLSRALLVASPPTPRIQTLPVGQSAHTPLHSATHPLHPALHPALRPCICCRMLYEEISKVVPLAQQGLFLHVVEDIQTSIRCATCSEPFQVLGRVSICDGMGVNPVHLCTELGPPQLPMLSMPAHTKRHLVCHTLPPVSCPGAPPVSVPCPVTPLSLTPALSLPCP